MRRNIPRSFMVIISCEPCSNIEPGRLITLGIFPRVLPPRTGHFHSPVLGLAGAFEPPMLAGGEPGVALTSGPSA